MFSKIKARHHAPEVEDEAGRKEDGPLEIDGRTQQLEHTNHGKKEKHSKKTAQLFHHHLPNRWLVAPYLASALLTPTLDARVRGPIE